MRWLKVLGTLGKLEILHDTLFFTVLETAMNRTPTNIAPYKYLCAIAGFPSVLPTLSLLLSSP